MVLSMAPKKGSKTTPTGTPEKKEAPAEEAAVATAETKVEEPVKENGAVEETTKDKSEAAEVEKKEEEKAEGKAEEEAKPEEKKEEEAKAEEKEGEKEEEKEGGEGDKKEEDGSAKKKRGRRDWSAISPPLIDRPQRERRTPTSFVVEDSRKPKEVKVDIKQVRQQEKRPFFVRQCEGLLGRKLTNSALMKSACRARGLL